MVKNPPASAGDIKKFRFDPLVRKTLEKEIATHSQHVFLGRIQLGQKGLGDPQSSRS